MLLTIIVSKLEMSLYIRFYITHKKHKIYCIFENYQSFKHFLRQIKTFSDIRLDGMCCYCGNYSTTRDHVPSKILLDKPYPENLPVVPCCDKCNQSFSLDEEYITCLLECILCNSTDIETLKRDKIRQILSGKKLLYQKIKNSHKEFNNPPSFFIDTTRLENFLIKLAKGHVKFENSEPVFEKPTRISFKSLSSMTQDEVDSYLTSVDFIQSFEVGSRAMQNFLISDSSVFSNWIEVQPNYYSYCVTSKMGQLSVKIFIRNFFAAEIIWDN